MGICTKLPTISSCCCGCTLQTGTLILGWFYLILTVLSLSSFGTIMSQLDKNDKDYNILFISSIILIVIYTLQLLLSILLLIGAYQRKPNLLLPYLWLEAIYLVFYLISVILAFIGNPFHGIVPLLLWLLGLYFFMVVNSFYQQLKGGARSRTPAI